MKGKKAFILSFIAFIAYYMQGMLYPSGSIISQGFLLLFLLIGFVFFVKLIPSIPSNPKFVNIWILFFLMLCFCFLLSPKTVYGSINEAIGTVSTSAQFKGIAMFSLSFFTAYAIARRQQFSDKWIFWIAMIFLAMSVLRFFYQLMTLTEEKESESAGVTNNAGYIILSVFPYLALTLKRYKIMTVISAIIIAITVIMSSKRGAIAILFAMLLFSLYYYFKTHKISFKSIAGVFIAVILLGAVIYNQYESNDYLQRRMEKTSEGDIGTRDLAYSMLFNHWANETNFFKFTFGNGTAQSIEVWGNYAHNDWLELLIDNGLLGVILYASIFISLNKYIRKSRLSPNYKLAAHLCVIYWLLKSIFSMGYMQETGAILLFLLGIIIGNYELTKKSYYAKNTLIH